LKPTRSRRRGFTRLPYGVKIVLALLLGCWLVFDGSRGAGDATAAVADAPVAAASSQAPETAEVAEPVQEPPDAGAAQEQEEAGLEAGQVEEEEHGPDAADFFLVFIAILIFAKVFGEGAERIGQPAVLGELVAGVLLGGSVLAIVPTVAPMAEIIHILAEVGVAILLFEIGLETDLKEMFRVGAASASVAAVGVFLPFFLGFLYWYWADPSVGAHPEGITLSMVAIFVGATLTATSVGITARVLTDLKLMHRSESRIIIGAAVIDDVLGLVILAVVSGLAAGAGVTALGITWSFTKAVGFLVVAVIIGNFVAPKLFRFIDQMSVRGVLLVSAFAFALLFGALADKADSAMIIGAFAAGIVLSTTNQFDLIVERIEPVADVFTPVFFVSVGAAVDVTLFIPGAANFDVNVIIVGAILIASDPSEFLDFFEDRDGAALAAYDVGSREKAKSYGLVELDGERVVDFQEKPDEPKSTLVSIACYAFPAESIRFKEYLSNDNNPDEPKWFLQWHQSRKPVHTFVFNEA
jgi:Kef-type K+ transport system membrane component KefB